MKGGNGLKKGKWLKYMYLAPIALMIVLSVFFVQLYDHFYETILEQNFANKVDDVNVMAVLTDMFIFLDDDWAEEYSYYRTHIRLSVETLNKQNATKFTTMYNEDYEVVAPDKYKAYDPLAVDSKLKQLVEGGGMGEYRLKGNNGTDEIKVHYRWIPSDPNLEKRFLVIVGVSRDSLDSKIANWVFIAAILLLLITSFLNFVIINQICKGAESKEGKIGEGQEGA
jgi:hypothetical protein